jgi:HSP20 family protein
MVPSKKLNGQNWLPDFFTDFFEGNIMHRIGGGPAMNVMEDDNSYKVELATPGMCKKDVNIHVTKDNKLVIEMEKKCDDKECCPEEKKDDKECKDKECKDKDCKNKRHLRREFSYAKLHQTLALPENADKNGIEATVKHGVLHIIIPKLSSAQIEAENKIVEVK